MLSQRLNTPPSETDNGQAWAEMLARIADKNIRLGAVLERVRERPCVSRSALIEEIERERGRIARELHAGAGQPLAGIKLNLDLLDHWFCALRQRREGQSTEPVENVPQEIPVEVIDALIRLQRLTEAALGQVRAVSHRLHPPEWQNLTTEAALRALVAESGIAVSCATAVEIAPLPMEPSHTVKVALYRCAQECISNVLRHSGATSFVLGLSATLTRIDLRVQDNGKGFRPGSQTARGIGLQSIREHVGAIGGSVRIAGDRGGTTISIAVPFSEE